MMPEAKARQTIDALLVAAGRHVRNAVDGTQVRFVGEIGHHPSIGRDVEVEVDTNLKRAGGEVQSVLSHAFF